MGISNIPGTITHNSLPGTISDIAGTITNGGFIPILFPGFVTNGLAYTQSGNLTYWNSEGSLATAAVDTLPLEYRPTTSTVRGYPYWPARTNSLRNSTMAGASAPSTLPNFWLQANSTGLAATVSGTGTENGVEYVDLRINGTTSGTGATLVYFESFTQIVASNGQIWTIADFVKLQAGSTTNITSISIGMLENTSGGATVTFGEVAITPPSTALGTYRPSLTRTLSGGGTVARVCPYIQLTISTGLAVDITLRIGLPQIEQGAYATAPIKTSTAAVTRAAPTSVISGGNFSFYNQVEGTFYGHAEIVNNNDGSVHYVVAADDASTANRVIGRATGAGLFATLGTVATATQWNLSTGNTVTDGTLFGFAFRYRLNDVLSYFNGANPLPDTSCTIPTVTQLNVGTSEAGTVLLGGWIKDLSYVPVGLTAANLASLST